MAALVIGADIHSIRAKYLATFGVFAAVNFYATFEADAHATQWGARFA